MSPSTANFNSKTTFKVDESRLRHKTNISSQSNRTIRSTKAAPKNNLKLVITKPKTIKSKLIGAVVESRNEQVLNIVKHLSSTDTNNAATINIQDESPDKENEQMEFGNVLTKIESSISNTDNQT